MTIELICEKCGNPFQCYQSDADRGRKYCSLACRSAHRFGKELTAARSMPVEFPCQNCGKTFTMMQAYLTAYLKRFKRDPLYCSQACAYEAQRKATETKHTFTCKNCGRLGDKTRKFSGGIYLQQQFCDNACKSEFQKKEAHARFQNGEIAEHVKRHGYVWISIPALASPTGVKKGMLKHRWVMEQKIGRTLRPEETVHHINGDRSDNRIENLELFSSRHGPGQRVTDKVDFAIEMLRLYPEFARQRGVALVDVAPEAH